MKTWREPEPRFVVVVLAWVLLSSLLGCTRATKQATQAGPWLMYGNNAARTFQSIYRGPRRPRILWSIEATSSGLLDTPPVAGEDGTVYAGVTLRSGSSLRAVTPDGKARWTYSPPGRILVSPTLAPDGTVYVGTETSEYLQLREGVRGRGLYAVSPAGKEKWHVETDGRGFSAPAIGSDGGIYFALQGAQRQPPLLYSVDSSGTVRWAVRLPGRSVEAVALGADSSTYVTASSAPTRRRWMAPGYVCAFGANGRKKWRRKLQYGPLTSPAVGQDGTIYVGIAEFGSRSTLATVKGGSLRAFDEDGRLLWGAVRTRVVSCPSIGPDGTLYVATRDRDRRGCVLRAIAADGSQRWTRKWPFTVSTPAIDREGVLHVMMMDTLIALMSDGRDKWRVNLYGTFPATPVAPVIAADGRLYCSTGGTRLHAIGER